MNPFLFFMNTLNSWELVIVAYSKPPGTNPMSFFDLINLNMLLLSTDYTPHIFRIKPTQGKFNIKRLESGTSDDILLLSALVFASIPKLKFKYHR